MIEIRDLRKSYTVFKNRKGMLKYAFGLAKAGVDYDIVDSLKGLNLSIKQGQVHGIIGMNGAGKSTLLKILTGVIFPTSGRFELHGRVAALLELGTGFHGELTGRQNIFLNGSLMGLSSDEVRKKLPEIESFSELGDFFDRPVKIYSSGMYVRLAFAFAVSVEPDVLIIDEALSVGDAYFQQKCLRKIEAFKKRGTTILFVSHDLGAVRALCETVTILSQGKEIFTGSPLQALDLYNDLLADFQRERNLAHKVEALQQSTAASSYESGNRDLFFKSINLKNDEGKTGTVFTSGQRVKIDVEMAATANVDDPDLSCGILIRDRLGYDVFGTNSYRLKEKIPVPKKDSSIRASFTLDLNLGPGEYVLTVALHSHQSHVEKNYHWMERAILFKVLPSHDFEFVGVARLCPKFSIEA